jgi:arabinogalactan endo-1,4-beta-galactosidase
MMLLGRIKKSKAVSAEHSIFTRASKMGMKFLLSTHYCIFVAGNAAKPL